MKHIWKRTLAGALSLVLATSLVLPAVAAVAETPPAPAEDSLAAGLLDVTAGTYTPDLTVQPGERYTLIALPLDSAPQALTAADLAAASASALFIGSALADNDGHVTFQDVRLRTAQAAVYYVAGPGLDVPYREALSTSVSAKGQVLTLSQDSSALLTLVDTLTGHTYNVGLRANASGHYDTGRLAPGKYQLRVEKPGYLPYVTEQGQELDVTGGDVTRDVDISDNVGDVDNNGVRDTADLAALLLYLGRTAPEDITADLDANGTVDQADAALLCSHLTTGQAADSAAVSVTDAALGGSRRCLSFSVAGGQATAAAFSLTLRSDAVQLLNKNGGLVAPSAGSARAACLLPAPGVDATLISWQVEGEAVTLSFALTAHTPLEGQLAQLFYRPVSGSTQDLFPGAFALEHSAVLVGQDQVVTAASLEYPNCEETAIDSLTIQQKSGTALTIPAAGQSAAAFPLSATGRVNGEDLPLTGVTWTLAEDYGPQVSIRSQALTVSAGAPEGEVTVLARRGSLTDSLTVQLRQPASVPTSVQLLQDGAPVSETELVWTAGEEVDCAFAAQVLDQFGKEMADVQGVRWSLSRAPEGLAVKNGALVPDWSLLAAGYYTFLVHARSEEAGAQSAVWVKLEVAPQLGALSLIGPTQAVLPGQDSAPLVLIYSAAALDRLGMPMELEQDIPTFTVSPMGNGVEADRDISGNYILTVFPSDEPQEQAGVYALTVQSGHVSDSLEVTLVQSQGDSAPVRAQLLYREGEAQDLWFTTDAGKAGSVSFSAGLVDVDDQTVAVPETDWQWTLSPDVPGFSLRPEGGKAALVLSDALTAGSYSLGLTATDAVSGLSAATHVFFQVYPVVDKLELTAPASVSIPTGEAVTLELALDATDTAGKPMDLPDGLAWTVVSPASGVTPEGVSIQDGALTVTSAAQPGDLTVSVVDPDTKRSAQAELTLTAAGKGTGVLTLYRQVTLDGATILSSSPVSGQEEVFSIKEGQSLTVSYSAMLVDQLSGTASSPTTDQVEWLGSRAFSVSSGTESGSYSSSVAAVYDSQAVAAGLRVDVYPNITGIQLDFGGDFSPEPPYTLDIPVGGPRVYTAELVAQILRDGATQTVPFRDLGLADYDLAVDCFYTGVYLEQDKDDHLLRFTVEPTAIQNSMSPPQDGDLDIRVLEYYLSYFPEEDYLTDSAGLPPSTPFFLSRQDSAPQTAILRRGLGAGSQFAFDTPSADRTAAGAGSLSNCYGLELLDQYGQPMALPTGWEDVWTLEGSPKGDDGADLITLEEPSRPLAEAYPTMASLRRLRVDPATPQGSYTLRLAATAGSFTRVHSVQLEVTPPVTPGAVQLVGASSITIPRYYYSYNSTTANTAVNTGHFSICLLTAETGGQEVDPTGYTALWSVSDSEGAAVSGVSVAPLSDSDSVNADVKVDRAAKPGEVTVTAQVLDPSGEIVGSASAVTELARGTCVPTVLQILRDGTPITKDSFSATSSTNVKQDYTFQLLDQYGQTIPMDTQRKVVWSLDGGSGVTATVYRNQDQVPYVRVSISHPQKSSTSTLTASLTFADGNTGKDIVVYARIPITVSYTGSSDSSGGGGGGGGSGGSSGGLESDTSTDSTLGTPASISISGVSYVNAQVGKAVTQSYSFSLKDKNGSACSFSDEAKVSWSASGLANGITFNTATRTLSVPATAAAGVTKVILTATYSSTVKTSLTVTVNIKDPNAGEPVTISVNGDASISTVQGTAASRAYSATLKDSNGKVVTVPEGSVSWSISSLTGNGVTVTFDPSTATLTVPATAKAGTFTPVLTVTYTTLKATLPVTITVNAPPPTEGTASDMVFSPAVSTSDGKGTATLTPAQEQTILSSNAQGGTVSIEPSGTTGLNTLTVSISASIAKTIATQKKQNLQVSNALGTVTLSPESLLALASKGGSTVTVTLQNTGDTLEVTFACGGTQADTLPGRIGLNAPTKGNVALLVGMGGDERVMKKSIVENGRMRMLLSGSAIVKTDVRDPAFADTQEHWAKNYIRFTAVRGLFQGVSATDFAPDGTMTRSMLVTVLHRLEDLPQVSSQSGFADVPGDSWYSHAVYWANAKGIVQGTSNGFAPDDPVTREQLATILFRYVKELGFSVNRRNSLQGFSDASTVSSWAKDAVGWAVAEGLINGKSDGLLDPGGAATRSEVSTILERLVRFLVSEV